MVLKTFTCTFAAFHNLLRQSFLQAVTDTEDDWDWNATFVRKFC